jgi:hypothetical protein
MKLIDFGSAVVFRYPFENEVVLATGKQHFQQDLAENSLLTRNRCRRQ